jgi:uncharacterized membrane protein
LAADRAGEKETARVEAFSDGVFAIAVTLLVLELKVPHQEGGPSLRAALLRQWPSYLALTTSFATIVIMWINHHMLFTHIRRVDRPLLLLNAAVLFGVTLVPFPTALAASYIQHQGEEVAAAVLSGTFLMTAIAFNVLWRYASSVRRTPPMLREPDNPQVRAIHAQYRWGPAWYLAALAVAPFQAAVSVAINLALAVFFALPPRNPAR